MKILRNLLLIASIIAFFYSCNEDKEALNGAQPEIPQPAICDFNEDLINDFSIAYYLGIWDGYDSEGNPAGGDMITGDIEPLLDNSVWCEIGGGWLFLQPGDTVYSDYSHDTTIHFWAESPVVLVAIATTAGSGSDWEKEWSIAGEPDREFYYLGFRIKKDNNYIPGWLKLKIHTSNGVIEITDKGITENDYIIVGE